MQRKPSRRKHPACVLAHGARRAAARCGGVAATLPALWTRAAPFKDPADAVFRVPCTRPHSLAFATRYCNGSPCSAPRRRSYAQPSSHLPRPAPVRPRPAPPRPSTAPPRASPHGALCDASCRPHPRLQGGLRDLPGRASRRPLQRGRRRRRQRTSAAAVIPITFCPPRPAISLPPVGLSVGPSGRLPASQGVPR